MSTRIGDPKTLGASVRMATAIDPYRVLASAPPGLSVDEAQAIAEREFGIRGSLRPLPSERDQNFHLAASDGTEYVLKFANASEDPGVTEFQNRALAHIAACDPELPVPRVYPSRDGATEAGVVVADGARHVVRLLGYLPGRPWKTVATTPALRRRLAQTLARLGLALRGLFHPAAGQALLWDVRHAGDLRALTGHIEDADLRVRVERFLDRFEAEVAPRLPGLRAQVIYNDLNPSNVLIDPDDPERLTGIIDFGDMVHGPLVADLAVATAYQIVDQDRPLEAAAEFAAAYHAVVPLEPPEADLLFDLTLARLCTTVTITSWRAGRYPENRDYILRSAAGAARALEASSEIPRDRAGSHLRAALGLARPAQTHAPFADLLARRERRMGAAYRLFYSRPLHLVRGEGVWLYDSDGRKYLDVYNNVPHVGHCHPRVVAAVSAQLATLNTHTRYLHQNVLELAERLTALMPPELNTCMFACTGSEANELALRIARAATGGTGVIVTAHAYHGNTGALAELSGSYGSSGSPGPWVATVPAPDPYRGPHRGADAAERYAEEVGAAIDRLISAGIRPAALLVDTIFSADGIVSAPPGFLALAAERIRAAGGLLIADEVQAGFGRTGERWWGFERHRVVPDLVTMGKPMGNGYPLAAVVAGAETIARFAKHTRYFNTFGGNPVAAAAGVAVLDVMARERLRENAHSTGAWLQQALGELAARHDRIGDVRGAGLFVGAELVRDHSTREPATGEAAAVVEGLRERGVLIGATGPHDNVLKMRPPLAFNREHAALLIEALDDTLARV